MPTITNDAYATIMAFIRLVMRFFKEIFVSRIMHCIILYYNLYSRKSGINYREKNVKLLCFIDFSAQNIMFY